MKKIIIILILLLIWPTVALAVEDSNAWAIAPGDGTRTTNQYPYFQFDHVVGDNHTFMGASFQIATGFNTNDIYIYEPFLSEYDTSYQDSAPLPLGTYYWKYCITIMTSYYDIYDICSYTRSLYIGKRVNKPRHKRCKANKKFHKKHCKNGGYRKKCSAIVVPE